MTNGPALAPRLNITAQLTVTCGAFPPPPGTWGTCALPSPHPGRRHRDSRGHTWDTAHGPDGRPL